MFKQIMWTNHIAAKLIFAFLFVILIPMLFTSLSFYLSASNIVKKNVRESAFQIAKQTSDSLSFMFNVGSDTSDLIYSNLKIQQAAMLKQIKSEQESQLNQNVTSTLNNLIYSSSFVRIIYVIREHGSSWGSGTFSQSKLDKAQVQNLEWVKNAKKKNGQLVWLPLQRDRFSGGGDNTELVLPVGRVLKDFDTLNNIGYIMVNLDGQQILQDIEQVKLGKTGKFFVVDQTGMIMIDNEKSVINTKINNPQLYHDIINTNAAEFEYKDRGIPYYGVKQPLSNGWILVGTVPIHEITQAMSILQNQILFYFFVFSLIAILIGLFIANRIIRPIKVLTQQMKQVQQGNLKARTTVQTRDEIGLMSRQFNKMIQRIEDLMEQVQEEQQQKQNAELRAVIHRINPHFLFNTLNTIRWLVKYNQSGKAYEGISSLLRLLEMNMGKEGHFITVEEELDIIKKYLVILELRYHRKFILNVSVDHKLKEFKIPRMLLQPLVENAIFHGIVPKSNLEIGIVDISIQETSKSVEFIVRDNGVGIPSHKLDQLKLMKKSIKEGFVGIGLQHVYESIDLYYGHPSKMTIQSEMNKGTEISLQLKKISESVLKLFGGDRDA